MTRPDPDELLQHLQSEDVRRARGKLKIFFGASAGVGKTWAMLAAAQDARRHGTLVKAGVVETHGRHDTARLLEDMEALPLRDVPYRGHVLREFDLDQALATLPPGSLLLLDELAHTNAPGSRHLKRWQDADELLAAGIDVWTTLNVQHLESLNDVVSGITGVRVAETVPDRVFERADEVVVVDLPPDELLHRLAQGKIYLPEQARHASQNFFRKGNLIALRELALRRTADRVDGQMRQYRSELGAAPVWQTREALLLCVGPDPRSVKLVQAATRLATQLDVPWHCIHVDTPRMQRRTERGRKAVLDTLKLAEQAGAVTAQLSSGDAAECIVRYAHRHNLSRVVLGRDCSRLRPRWRRTLAEAIGARSRDLDIVQIALPAPLPENLPEGGVRGPGRIAAAGASRAWRGYALAAAVPLALGAATAPLRALLAQANLVMLFLLAVVLVALRLGRGPAVAAAVIGVLAFDFVHVPPYNSFDVGDLQYLLTFAVMLTVGLVIGQLTASLRFQARVATRREERTAALYGIARELSAALLREQVADAGAAFARSQFGARFALLPAGDNDRVLPAVQAHAQAHGFDADLAIAQWAFDHAQNAGLGTDTLPRAPALYVPLRTTMRTRGVMAIQPHRPHLLAGPEQTALVDALASLLALSLERIHYIEVAQSTTVQMESERLRHSLLAAISHDLRTPLAAQVGMAESLAMLQERGDADAGRARREIAASIRDSALRMNALVENLLDMARLQSGQVRLRLQWMPLEEVVGSALEALGQALDAHPLHVKLTADLPLVELDAVLFERVFVNLLENAAKFSPPGTPIEIAAEARGDKMAIAVDDQGPGLPAGREDSIFEMFERGQRESATPGVGLGLAICRAIVQAHHGTITASSKPGGGARFAIELPLGKPPAVPSDEMSEDAA